jgi:hypothetical protein
MKGCGQWGAFDALQPIDSDRGEGVKSQSEQYKRKLTSQPVNPLIFLSPNLPRIRCLGLWPLLDPETLPAPFLCLWFGLPSLGSTNLLQLSVASNENALIDTLHCHIGIVALTCEEPNQRLLQPPH